VRINVSDSMFCSATEVGPVSAICTDGSSSNSQNRSGTCSSHGGVRCWVCPGPRCCV
jgi:hypothetical protein